ncbi:MAG: FecR domain-containing protein [bacterium]|nr:FecR domain-containing protein [bacterium]
MSDQSMKREELARKLLEDPTQDWPEDLQALNVPVRPMPAALRQKLVGLANSDDGAGAESVSSKTPPKASANKIVFRIATAAAFGGAVAAAFAFYLTIFRVEAPHATLVFAEGRVTREEQPLQVGDKLREGDAIVAGEQALAVLAAKDAGREFLLRLRGDATLSFETLQSSLVQARLKRGRIYAKASADASADRWPLRIVTPLAVASVRGTEFTVESPGADTVLATQEGSVEFRRRWAALEDLPPQLFEQSEFLSDARRIFIDASATVPADSQSTVSAQDFARRVGDAGEIAKVLSASSIADLRGRSSTTGEEIKAALAELEQSFPTHEDRTESLGLLKAAFGDSPAVQPVAFEDMQERRFALIEPADKEREARYLEIRAAQPEMDAETFRREALRALGKPPQTVILKNGETIFGVIFGENANYRIYTADGIRVVAPAEVEEILFN